MPQSIHVHQLLLILSQYNFFLHVSQVSHNYAIYSLAFNSPIYDRMTKIIHKYPENHSSGNDYKIQLVNSCESTVMFWSKLSHFPQNPNIDYSKKEQLSHLTYVRWFESSNVTNCPITLYSQYIVQLWCIIKCLFSVFVDQLFMDTIMVAIFSSYVCPGTQFDKQG